MVVRLKDLQSGNAPTTKKGVVRLSDLSPKATTPSRTPINGPVEQDDITGSLGKTERLANEYQSKKKAARELPVIGKALKGLDVAGEFIESNPITGFLTQTTRDIYSSGPAGAIAGLEGAAVNLLGRYAPSLIVAPSIGKKAAGAAVREGLVGAPLGAAQTAASTPDFTAKDLIVGTALGAGGGAALSGLGTAAVKGITRLADLQANKLAQNAVRTVGETTPSRVTSPFADNAATGNQIARGYTENVGKTFGNTGKVVRLADLEPTSSVPEIPATAPPKLITSNNTPESLPQERRTITTLRESGKLTPETQAAIEASPSRTYTPITNIDTVERANRLISRDIDKAEAYVLGGSQKQLDADRVATGFRLIDEFQKAGQTERAVTVAEQLAEKLTKAGQTVQAASLWNRLTPEGALLAATRKAKDAGRTLETVDADRISDFANVIQRSGQSSERASNVMDITAKLKNKEKLTDDELKELTTFVDDAKSMLGAPKRVKQARQPRLPSDKDLRQRILDNLDSKEAALKDFISKNSGRVSSTPLDLWGAYAALGAVKLAKGTISFSRWAQSMVDDIGDGVKPYLTQLYDRAKQEAELLERITPNKTAAERIANKYIEAERLTEHDAKLIHDLAERIGKINANDKQAAAREMQAILNKYEKSSIADKINALRYIAMLGNTMTQLTNIISSPLVLLERSFINAIQTPFDIAASKVMGKPRNVTFKQGPALFENFFRPVGDYVKGAKIGGESGWRGLDPNGITTQNDIRGLAFKSKWNPARWAEGTLGAVMKAADYGAYNAAVQTRLRQMAYLDALNKGIKGNENIRQYMSRYLNNVDDNIVALADKFGKEVTFQTRSKAAEGAQKLVRGANLFSTLGRSDKIGLGSALLPFVRTPTNLLMAGLERTPLGLVKGLYELSTMAKNPNITPRDVSETIVKSILGTAGLTGTGYVLGNLGIITGDSSSKSKDVQALEQDVGRGKFKFNTTAFARMMQALITGNMDDIESVSKYREGDKQLNYNRLQPFAFPAAIGATFAEQQNQAQTAADRGEEIPLSTQVGRSLVSAGQSLFDISLLKGLKDTFDVQPGEGVGDIAKRIGQNYIKSFSPSLLGQEARRQDESQRQTTYEGLVAPVKEYLQSRTPGLSQQLPPKVTNMGEIKRNEEGIIANYLNPLQSSDTQYNKASQIIYDLIQKTGDEKLAPSPFEKTVRGKKNGVTTSIKLTPEQYAQAQQNVGQEVSKRILLLPSGISNEAKAKRVEKIYSDAREKERNKLKKELGLR